MVLKTISRSRKELKPHGETSQRSRAVDRDLEKLSVVPLTVLLTEEQQRNLTEEVVETTIRRGDLVELVGEEKAGKTTLVARLLAAILRGDPFIGKKTRRGRVAYLGIEQRAEDLAKMFQAYRVDLRDVWVVRSNHLMRLPSGIKNLRELILRVPLDLLVLDPITDFIDEHAFSRSGGFDENDAMHWKAIINPLQQLARQTGCAILFTRHKSKAMSGWKGAYKTSPARGSNYPETKADIIMNLTSLTGRSKGGWVFIIQGKGIRKQDLRLVSPDGHYDFALAPVGDVIPGNQRETEPLRQLLRKNEPLTPPTPDPVAKYIRDFVNQNFGRVQGKQLQDEIRRLRKNINIPIPMKGKEYHQLLKRAGISPKILHGRIFYVVSVPAKSAE